MEKIKNFFANKKIGYYLVILDVILAVFLGIFFFLTYKDFPAGYGGQGMASNAYTHVPEVIGLFMFLGAVVDIVALLLPEYLPIHLAAIVAYCVSLMKQVYCIPNLVADEINNIHYQGGSFPLCLSWLIITFVIIGAAIAVMFLGMIAQDEESAKMREKPAGKKLIKIAAGGGAIVVALAVVLTIYGITEANIKKGSAAEGDSFNARVQARAKTFQDQVIQYDFNPAEFKLTEEDNQYYNHMSDIPSADRTYSRGQVREDAYRVYCFEGSTAEGWQGDYSQKYVRFTLWDDGMFNGNINGSNIYGYWYNVDEAGAECLVMISSDGNNDMVGQKLSGSGSYYEWLVDARASYNGGRMIKGNGCKYYPVIGMFVDTGSDKTPTFKVGSEFSTSGWTCMQVRNNLVASSIFDAEHEVTFTAPDMSTAGTKTVKARWKVEEPVTNAIEEGNSYYYEQEIEINIVD